MEKSRKDGDNAVSLDFGLSKGLLSEQFQKAWPYDFGLVYSVTLGKDSLETQLQVVNKGTRDFDFQILTHSYLNIEVGSSPSASENENLLVSFQDISKIRIGNLQSKTYIDKTRDASTFTENSSALVINGETDRVYENLDPNSPVVIFSADDGNALFSIIRDALQDTVIWNPWEEKTKGMSDLSPDDAYKRFLCVESGSVSSWQKVEAGDSWVGAQTIKAGPQA